MRGVPFVDAVLLLTEGRYFSQYQENTAPKASPSPKPPPKPFSLPKPNKNNDKVFAYLRGRGISGTVISRCIKQGTLYENSNHRCVFVGKDGDKPKFACERGITEDLKKDVAGSDKRFSFTLPPENPNSQNLVVTEAPIDCLAHFSIHEAGQTGFDGHRLSLGGVSSLALTATQRPKQKLSIIKR